MLLARIYELFPLVCARCGGEMEIIAFITEAPSVQAILTHIGEPCEALGAKMTSRVAVHGATPG